MVTSSETRQHRRLTRRLLSVAFLLLGTQTAVPSEAACSTPRPPALKAVWLGSSGPSFTVRPASGALPSGLAWRSVEREGGTWGVPSAWKRHPLKGKRLTITVTPDADSALDAVAQEAFAWNRCGSSKWVRVNVPVGDAPKTPAFNSSSSVVTAAPAAGIALDLPLAVGSVDAEDLAPDWGNVTASSDSPEVCSASTDRTRISLRAAGLCRLRLAAGERVAEVSIRVQAPPTPLPEAAVDRPDEQSGFQIHVVYVTAAGTASRGQYRNGLVNQWVQLAQDWLDRRVGKRLRMDTFEGELDVTTLKSSYTAAQIATRGGANGGIDLLRAEYLKANGATSLRGKTLLFVLDASIGAGVCGYAGVPGDAALVATGSTGCWNPATGFLGRTHGLNWMSVSLLHEIFHTFGVEHTCVDRTDLMLGEGCTAAREAAPITLDASGRRYVGGSASGVDLLQLKIWSDGSGVRNTARPGTCYVQQPCRVAVGNWTSGSQAMQLQRLLNGSWQTLGTFEARAEGSVPGYPFTYDAIWTPAVKGAATLRFRLAASGALLAYEGQPIMIEVPY